MEACQLTHKKSPISFSFYRLRPYLCTAVAGQGFRRWTGATPPFLPPGSAQQSGAIYIRVATPGRVAPVPKIPAGRPKKDPQEEMRENSPDAETCRARQRHQDRRPLLDQWLGDRSPSVLSAPVWLWALLLSPVENPRPVFLWSQQHSQSDNRSPCSQVTRQGRQFILSENLKRQKIVRWPRAELKSQQPFEA